MLGIPIIEAGVFHLRDTVVTLPLPGSVLVYAAPKPPSPIIKRKGKNPYMHCVPQKLASIIRNMVVSYSLCAKSSPLLVQELRIVF